MLIAGVTQGVSVITNHEAGLKIGHLFGPDATPSRGVSP